MERWLGKGGMDSNEPFSSIHHLCLVGTLITKRKGLKPFNKFHVLSPFHLGAWGMAKANSNITQKK